MKDHKVFKVRQVRLEQQDRQEHEVRLGQRDQLEQRAQLEILVLRELQDRKVCKDYKESKDQQDRLELLVQLDQRVHNEYLDLQQQQVQQDQRDQLVLEDDLQLQQILHQLFLHLFLVMLGLTALLDKYMSTLMDIGLSLLQVTLDQLDQPTPRQAQRGHFKLQTVN
jgi:hypothetical protein